MKRIGVTVITGFLGSGKTTLIRHLLTHAHGKRLGLIINEFGELGVDREVLAGCGSDACRTEDMVELANGCICCTVAEEFIPTMQMLLERDDRLDHILIETSGLALPQPLVRAFNWPEIKSAVTIDGIITVVDAAALSEGRFAADEKAVDDQRRADEMIDHETALGELFRDQLICADLVVLNKADLIDEATLLSLTVRLQGQMRAGTGLIAARNGEVDARAVLGMGLGSEDDLEGRDSLHELDHGGAGHEHDDFDSVALSVAESRDKNEILGAVERVIRAHKVLRLKGFAAIEGVSARLAIQAVGPRVNSWFDRPWADGELRETRLVAIGESPLDKSGIAEGLVATGYA